MADVLIVCVREDEPRAKALAEMFEAAGFSIGGAPSSDGALRSSGAGLVVWSQASIRSRPFLDAAQRVINAQKAVVASLIEPPPPSSIGDSPVFDLSHWDGDPNDPSLDPLFFAVDRMVNSQRASVGAGAVTREPPAAPVYEPPPPPPRVQRAPPPPPVVQPPTSYGRSAGDPLGTEAEHWRAIRDSRNPSDFMDYLARYGPEGAFAEVAELRLKQLTSQGAEVRAPAAAPPVRAPQPARPTLPPRADVTPRRADPPLAARRDPAPAPARRPPPDRSYDRHDLRDPPRGEGGPLRAFILIALLGGAALAGGLYFGGGMPNFGAPAAQEQQVADIATPPLEEPADALEEAPSVALADAAGGPSRAVEPASRREPPRPPRTQPEEAAPAPVTSWNGPSTNTTTGGPVSLAPGQQPAANPAAAPPAVPSSIPASVLEPTRPATTVARPGSVIWAQRPSARRISDLYPDRASREGLGGRVELDCSVLSNLALACSIASESPSGVGFGRAALNASNSYRAAPRLSNGQDAVGARTRIAVQFQAPAD